MEHKCNCQRFIKHFNNKDNYIDRENLKEIKKFFFENNIDLTRKETSLVHNVFETIENYK